MEVLQLGGPKFNFSCIRKLVYQESQITLQFCSIKHEALVDFYPSVSLLLFISSPFRRWETRLLGICFFSQPGDGEAGRAPQSSAPSLCSSSWPQQHTVAEHLLPSTHCIRQFTSIVPWLWSQLCRVDQHITGILQMMKPNPSTIVRLPGGRMLQSSCWSHGFKVHNEFFFLSHRLERACSGQQSGQCFLSSASAPAVSSSPNERPQYDPRPSASVLPECW